MRPAHSILVACCCLGTALSPALAQQQEFELGDDDRWVETTNLDPESPEGRLAIVRRSLATESWVRAEFLATQWIDRHPVHPLLPDAYVLRGDALVGQEEYYKALFDFELVARKYIGSEAFLIALERELDIATRFITGTRRRFLGMRWVSAVEESEELLIRIQERLPGSRLAEESALVLANHYFTSRDMPLAAEMYGIFIENFPRSEHLAIARKRLVYAHLADFKGPEHDASGLEEARAHLLRIQAVSPATAMKMGAGALLSRIDDSMATKRLTTARWYVRTGDYIAAEFTIRRLIEQHPRSIAAMGAIREAAAFQDQLPPTILAETHDYRDLVRLLDAAPADQTAAPAPTEDATP